MSAFLDCVSCSGFVPHDTAVCPHCGEAVADKPLRQPAAQGGLFGKLVMAATGGLMSLTLMACYGLPYTCDDVPPPDADNDGYDTASGYSCGDDEPEPDCDDNDATIHPGADDPLGDGIDQNCDGQDGVAGSTTTGTGGSGGSMSTGGAGGGGGSMSTGGAGGGGGSMSTGGAGGG